MVVNSLKSLVAHISFCALVSGVTCMNEDEDVTDSLSEGLSPHLLALLKLAEFSSSPAVRIIILALVAGMIPSHVLRMIAATGMQASLILWLFLRNELLSLNVIGVWVLATMVVCSQDIRRIIYKEVITYYSLSGANKKIENLKDIVLGDLPPCENKVGGFRRKIKFFAVHALNSGLCMRESDCRRGSGARAHRENRDRKSVEEIWAEKMNAKDGQVDVLLKDLNDKYSLCCCDCKSNSEALAASFIVIDKGLEHSSRGTDSVRYGNICLPFTNERIAKLLQRCLKEIHTQSSRNSDDTAAFQFLNERYLSAEPAYLPTRTYAGDRRSRIRSESEKGAAFALGVPHSGLERVLCTLPEVRKRLGRYREKHSRI